MKNSRYANFCLLAVSSCLSWLIGFHFAIINPLAPILKKLYNNTHQARYNVTMSETSWVSLLTLSASSLVVSGLLATFTTKSLLKYMSSNRIQQMAHVINIVAIATISLGTGITGSYEVFIVGRFLAGYPCGVGYVIAPLQISELSSHSQRDFWQSVFGVSISLGFLTGPVLGHPDVLGSSLWPIANAMALLPSLCYLVASLKIPDTPYRLLRMGKKDKAEKVLLLLRKANKNIVTGELKKIIVEIGETKTLLGFRDIVKVPGYRNQLLGVLVLQLNQILSGITNVNFYSSLLFIEAGFSERSVGTALVIIYSFQFVVSCFGSKIVRKLGGLRVCIGSNILIIFALVLFTASSALRYLAESVLSYISIAAIAIFMIVWSGGINIGTFVLISEITIEPTRATCMTIGNIALWVSIWVVGFIPPYLQLALGSYAMTPWIVFAFVFLIYMCTCLPNTRGKTFDEIQEFMNGSLVKRNIKFIKTKTVELPQNVVMQETRNTN